VNAISKISPWTAKPLSEAAKNAKFRAVMDLAAERVILGRSAIITGWTIGGVGAACFAASIFGWVTLLPLKTSEVKFFLVDKSTGIISEPVGLQDAPRIFGAAVEQQYLKRYIEAREGWVPEMDERNDHVTKLMSTPDEQARYAAGAREILECFLDGRPIRDEYLIVDGGKLAGAGAHSYSEGDATGGSEEATRFASGPS